MQLTNFQSKYQLSNQELADLFGCSLSTIVKWKGSRVAMPLHAIRFLRFCDLYARGNRKVLSSIDDLADMDLRPEPVDAERLWDTFAQLGDHSSGWSVVHWMPDTSIIRATDSFYEMLRMPVPSPGKRTWSSFLDDPEQTLGLEVEMTEVIQKGKPQRRRRSLRTIEGEVLELEWLDCPVRQTPGSLVSVISVLVDRTTENGAFRANFRYLESIEQLLQGLETALMIVNSQGLILDESRSSRRLRQSLGMNESGRFSDLFPAPKTLSWKRILTDRATTSIDYAGRLQHGNESSERPVHFRASLKRIQWKGQHCFLFEYGLEGLDELEKAKDPGPLVGVRLEQEEGLILQTRLNGNESLFATGNDRTWDFCISLMAKRHGAMRAYIFQVHGLTGELLSNTHEWCAPGISPEKEGLQNSNFSYTPWWQMKMRRGEPMIISQVENLPAEAVNEKRILTAQGIVGLVAVPILIDQTLRGFIGLDFADPLDGDVQPILDELREFSSNLIGDMIEEEALRARRKDCRLREKLMEAIDVGQFDWTIENAQVRFDAVAARHFQLQSHGGEVMVDGFAWWKDHLHPDDQPKCELTLKHFLKHGDPAYVLAYRFSRDRKNFRPFLECGIPSKFGDDGSIVAVKGYIVDLERLPLEGIPRFDLENNHRNNCLRGDLLASLSHELRSPLHILENLIEEVTGPGQGAGKDWSDIRGVVSELGDKIGDIIKLSDHLHRPESVVEEKFAMGRIIDQLRADEAIGDVKRVGEFPRLVRGDPGKMHSIFQGLAQELGRQSGGRKAELSFRGEVTGASSWQLECRMSVPGGKGTIDLRDSLGNLFRPREDPIRSRSPGLGVRVALSLERLQLLGGQIDFADDAADAATLRITLPLTVVEWARLENDNNRGGNLRILVVEDHPVMAKILMRGLESQSSLYDCAWASNGREALEWCRSNQADFILLDLQMPVMDGFEFLKEMEDSRDEVLWPLHGIAITSALIAQEHTDRLKKYPILEFFEKPFDFKVLHRFLQQNTQGRTNGLVAPASRIAVGSKDDQSPRQSPESSQPKDPHGSKNPA